MTVVEKGYLEFNPIKYTDPMRSIVFPLLCLALGGIALPGGAVWINRSLLRSQAWDSAVSLAGPATNAALAVLIAMLFRLGIVPEDPNNSLSIALSYFGFLQVCATVFNMLPVPGFDGFGILAPFFSWEFREKAMSMSRMFYMIIFLLMWKVDSVSGAFFGVCFNVSQLLGINNSLVFNGMDEFRFWDHMPN